MKVVVAGGSGFLGSHLVDRLLARGDEVVVLSRDPEHVRVGRGVRWDGRTAGSWSAEIEAAHALVNLAGENIAAGRWTAARRKKLTDSRIDATRAIAEALVAKPGQQRVLVNASATGIYGDRGDEELDERSAAGKGFLAELTSRWEAAARIAESAARVVLLRFGVVLSGDGGALPKMTVPFRFGAGGPVGSGNQWMSWVSLDDAVGAVVWAIDTPKARGVYNATAPEPVRNRDFARAAGRVLRRPAIVRTPAIALRVAFGRMADEVLLGGQRVLPRRLVEEGFRFQQPGIETALRSALLRER